MILENVRQYKNIKIKKWNIEFITVHMPVLTARWSAHTNRICTACCGVEGGHAQSIVERTWSQFPKAMMLVGARLRQMAPSIF